MNQSSKWREFTRSYSLWDDNNVKGFFGYGENEFAFLSNFYPCDVYFEGMLYPSSEHAYMASKTLEQNERLVFAKYPPLPEEFNLDGVYLYKGAKHISPAEAKRLGQSVNLRPNWDNIKYDMMLSVVFDKFWRNKDLRKRLLNTGDKYLEETNHWKDVTWGVDYKTGEGKNYLGKILMKVRECLK